MVAEVRKGIGFHGLDNNLGRLAVAVLCLCGRNAEKRKLKRDGAAANTKIESAPAQLVQHADLLESAQGVIEIQQHHQRPEPQLSGALRYGGQEQVGGSRQTMGRPMMLCDVIGAKAGLIARLGDF